MSQNVDCIVRVWVKHGLLSINHYNPVVFCGNKSLCRRKKGPKVLNLFDKIMGFSNFIARKLLAEFADLGLRCLQSILSFDRKVFWVIESFYIKS